MKAYTESDKAQWRTGLFAANPQQMKALMAELDHLEDAIKQIDKRLIELETPIERNFLVVPDTILGRAWVWVKDRLGIKPKIFQVIERGVSVKVVWP